MLYVVGDSKNPVMCGESSRRPAENLVTIGVEPHVPQTDTVHQFLGVFKFAVPTEERLDKFAAGVAAHRHCFALALGHLPHKVLACFEQLLEAHPESFAAFQKVRNGFARFTTLDTVETLVRPLDLACQLDQQQPQIACNIGHRGGSAIMKNGPVVDPLAQRVGVEHTAEENNRSFGRVPVLGRISGRNSSALGIFFGGYWRSFRARG